MVNDMLRAFLCMLAIAVACSAVSFVPDSSLVIESVEHTTDVHIVEGSTLSLQVDALDGANEDYIFFDGLTLSIKAENVNKNRKESSAPALSGGIVRSVVPLVLSSLMLPSFKKTNAFFFLGMCGYLYTNINGAQAQGGSYLITLTVPPSVTFQQLTVAIEQGLMDGADFRATNLNIQSNSQANGITLNRVGVRTSAVLNTAGPLTLNSLQSLTTAVTYDLTTASDASVSFTYYVGQATVNHGASSIVSLTGEHCSFTQNGNTRSGSCLTGSSSFELTAGGDVDVDFGAVDLIRSTDYLFNDATRWKFREEYNGDGGSVAQAGPDTVTASKTSNQGIFWMICDECLPMIRPDNQYTVSFDFNPSVSIDSVQVGILKNPNYKAYYQLPSNSMVDQPDRWLATTDMDTDFDSGSWNSANSTFSVAEKYYSGEFSWRRSNWWEDPPRTNLNKFYAALAIRVDLASGQAGSFSFRNVQLTTSPEAYVLRTLVAGDSQHVTLLKASPDMDPNPRTDCPWDEPNLQLWQDASTWGGALPNPGQTITLPANTKVLVTSSTFQDATVYQRVVVPLTSELIFSDAVINWNVKDILVEGSFRIGSPTCRVESAITLTFYGERSTANTISPAFGTKGIAVTGSIDMHGKQFHYSWTRLATSAEGGDDRIIVQDDVNWEVGQEVMITTTFWQDEWWPQNEVRTISAMQGRTIIFDAPLTYHHYGGAEYQAEVGLLSRQIVLQGAYDSEAEQFGGHVLVTGVGRFSGVSAFRMGQRNMIARYPFHFHMAGYSPDSFVKDCACSHSYFRCVTIHGTHELTVMRNVAYDITGFAYYMEDGVEENNTIAYNLAAFIHTVGPPAAGAAQGGEKIVQSSTIAQPADAAAAGFYITNAHNRLYGNAASGGWTGFSFPNLFVPIGMNQQVPVDPSSRPTLQFEGNSAHSAGYEWGDGSCVYVGGHLYYNNGNLEYESGRVSRMSRLQIDETYNGQDWEGKWGSPKVWMRFNNTKIFLCQRAVNHWGDSIELVSYEVHDSTRGATLFGEAWMGDALINGKSGNPITGMGTAQGFEFYDTWVKSLITNTEFRNYNPVIPAPNDAWNDNFCIVSMTHSDKFKPQGISATRAITYSNVDPAQIVGHRVRDTGASRYFNFVDWDGSATGTNVPTIVGSHSDWWRYSSACTKNEDWDVWVCPKGSREVGNLEVLLPGIQDGNEPPHGTSVYVGRHSLFGDGVAGNRTSALTTMPGVTGVTDHGWYFYADAGSPTSLSVKPYIIPEGHWIVFAMRYPPGTTFTINTDYQWGTQGDGPVTAAASMQEMMSGDGYQYYWNGNHLFIKMVNHVQPNPPYFERDGARIFSIQNSYRYQITANCGGQASCNVEFQVPSETF